LTSILGRADNFATQLGILQAFYRIGRRGELSDEVFRFYLP
jgi:hypothetical protein